MDLIEQHILTLSMGLGGWFGVLYAVASQFINGGEFTTGAVARYAVMPFVSSIGAVIIVESTRGWLFIISSTANAMLNRFVIIYFLEMLVPLTILTGLAWSSILFNKNQVIIDTDNNKDADDDIEDDDEEDDEHDEEDDEHDEEDDDGSNMDTSDEDLPRHRILNKSESWYCEDCRYVGRLDEKRDACDCYEDEDMTEKEEEEEDKPTCYLWG